MSNAIFTHLYDPDINQLGPNPIAFLATLDGPTIVHITGHETRRCRILVTLLHSNEPSGLKATYRLIKEQVKPQTNIKIIIASVVAARSEPLFTYRMLPGQRDLNRCFDDALSPANPADPQSVLAAAIRIEIANTGPEAIIDLHNTSGSGPAFSVSIEEQPQHVALASLFTHNLIKTDIRLGAIMEQDFNCPIITVEAGGSKDAAADETAYQGLKKYFTSVNVFEILHPVTLIRSPRRLELQANCTIGFGEFPDSTQHITMRHDIERFNFGITDAGEQLGWVNHGDLTNFKLDSVEPVVDDFFKIENGILKSRRALTLFMVTTRPDIAKSDCLFYFVAPS